MSLECIAASSLEGPKELSLLEMGFEVETSGIKIDHPDENTILIILESADGKWQLTSDTSDSKKIDHKDWVNLECRTVGGLSKDEINKYARFTYKTMSEIKAMCDDGMDGKWTLNAFKVNYFWGRFVGWGKSAPDSVTFCTKKEAKSLDFDVRPQLSFSFPLSKVKDVFHGVLGRTDEHKQEVMPKVFDLVKREEKDEWKGRSLDDIKSAGLQIIYQKNPYKTKAHNLFIDTNFLKELLAKETLSNGESLLLLASAYIYDLFFQNIINPMKEPGPKPFLSVVSRVPFSEMYAQLSEGEKTKFQTSYQRYFSGYEDLKIKPYVPDSLDMCFEDTSAQKDKHGMINESDRIALGRWFDSIISPRDRAENIKRDLLSPPLYVDREYSMGAVSADKIRANFALIEARRYSDMIRLKDRKLDRFVSLVKD